MSHRRMQILSLRSSHSQLLYASIIFGTTARRDKITDINTQGRVLHSARMGNRG